MLAACSQSKMNRVMLVFFFFSSRRRHTRLTCDWSSDVCSSDLPPALLAREPAGHPLERRGRAGPWQRDDGALGQPGLQEVASTDLGLADRVARAHASCDEDDRRQAALVQRGCVVEACPEHRRRTAVVLRGTEDGDRVRGRGLIVRSRERHRDDDGRPPEGEHTEADDRGPEPSTQGPERHGGKDNKGGGKTEGGGGGGATYAATG